MWYSVLRFLSFVYEAMQAVSKVLLSKTFLEHIHEPLPHLPGSSDAHLPQSTPPILAVEHRVTVLAE